MKIHEYQAKALLARHGVAVPEGRLATTVDEAVAGAAALPGEVVVVKAQVHAGGRGKGRFEGTDLGGVKVLKDRGRVAEVAGAMLGRRLVTHQTGPAGTICRKVWIEAGVAIEREVYLAAVLDRAASKVCVMACAEGGMEIEEVAARTPERIIKVWVEPGMGLVPYQARKLAFGIGLPKAYLGGFCQLAEGLVRAFEATDAGLIEINPLITTKDGKVMALDGKITFDDNALYRHPDVAALRDLDEEDPAEIEAKKYDLSYIKLDGSIGCMVNGAGLAMATMDIIKLHGAEPANFLDVGGGASAEKVAAAFRIICRDPNVQAILVNIFGGIMRCDVIATGIIDAVKQVSLMVPLVVRLEGTNVAEGKRLLSGSGLPITEAADLEDAARKVVAARAGK